MIRNHYRQYDISKGIEKKHQKGRVQTAKANDIATDTIKEYKGI
jgi:hypothetical protein